MTEVLRYGHHWMPSTVVVTFNQALDLGTAQDAQNYTIKSITTHGVKWCEDDVHTCRSLRQSQSSIVRQAAAFRR